MINNDTVVLDTLIEARHSKLAPELPDDEFFELFVSEQLLSEYGLSWEELAAGILGGGNDGGIALVVSGPALSG